jgi:hypothetical protein
MDYKRIEGNLTDEEKWQQLKFYLSKGRNVSFWRSNIVAYQKLFGLKDDDLSDDNWSSVNESIKAKTAAPDWYEHVIKDVCNLEIQVRNVPMFEDWDSEYFLAVLRLDRILHINMKPVRSDIEKYIGRGIDNLATVKSFIHKIITDYRSRGAIGVKFGHAYFRSLYSERIDDRTADEILQKILADTSVSEKELNALRDSFIFYVCEICSEMDLIFQVHTGVQKTYCNVPDSNPILLLPLIKEFPKVRFDIFHAGYPYSRELGMMAKNFPNVWLNMAWMYIISMAASRQILSEWIDLVPSYRLLGFGSDVGYPELIYSHLVMARSCVADVLAAKTESDFLSRSEAMSLARGLFLENGMDFYRINGHR